MGDQFSDQDLQDFVFNGRDKYLSHLSVDCTVFGFDANHLRVLLLKWKQLPRWSLAGGFIKKNEDIDNAAHRVLKERTGLDQVFLGQFHTFGSLQRWQTTDILKMFESQGLELRKDNWMLDRFVSIGYYALVDYNKVRPQPDALSEECAWWGVGNLPDLMYDHHLMVEKALQTMRNLLNYQPVGRNLLPETFTIPELQKLYETILDEELDRRNFQKKIFSLDILERLDQKKTGGAHRAPFLYRFK